MSERIEVTYAKLQQSVFVPNVGEYGPTLSHGPEGKTKDIKMFRDDNWLYLTTKGVTIEIPKEMIACCVTKEG